MYGGRGNGIVEDRRLGIRNRPRRIYHKKRGIGERGPFSNNLCVHHMVYGAVGFYHLSDIYLVRRKVWSQTGLLSHTTVHQIHGSRSKTFKGKNIIL